MFARPLEIPSLPISSPLHLRLSDETYEANNVSREVKKLGRWTDYRDQARRGFRANFSFLGLDPEEVREVVLIGSGLNFHESVLAASCFPNADIKLVDHHHAEEHQATLERIAEDLPELRDFLSRMSFQQISIEYAWLTEGTADVVYASGVLVDKQLVQPEGLPDFLKAVRKALKPGGHFVCFGMHEHYQKATDRMLACVGRGPVYVVNQRDPMISDPFVNFQKD